MRHPMSTIGWTCLAFALLMGVAHPSKSEEISAICPFPWERTNLQKSERLALAVSSYWDEKTFNYRKADHEGDFKLFDWFSGSQSWKTFQEKRDERRRELSFKADYDQDIDLVTSHVDPKALEEHTKCVIAARRPAGPGLNLWVERELEKTTIVGIWFVAPDQSEYEVTTESSIAPTGTIPKRLRGNYSNTLRFPRERKDEFSFVMKVGPSYSDSVSLAGISQSAPVCEMPKVCFVVKDLPCPERRPYCDYINSNNNTLKRDALETRCRRWAQAEGWEFDAYVGLNGHPGCRVKIPRPC